MVGNRMDDGREVDEVMGRNNEGKGGEWRGRRVEELN